MDPQSMIWLSRLKHCGEGTEKGFRIRDSGFGHLFIA
jgi:hypothetical protein